MLEKPSCFMCKIEFVPDSKKIGINDFIISKIPIPNGFAFSTKICTNCFNSLKKNSPMKTDQVTEFEQRTIELEPSTSQLKIQSDSTVIHFKNENIAVLHKTSNSSDEFISALNSLTKEGYHLMSIENDNSSPNSNSSKGSFFYFQRIKT